MRNKLRFTIYELRLNFKIDDLRIEFLKFIKFVKFIKSVLLLFLFTISPFRYFAILLTRQLANSQTHQLINS
jgi:hypothetical protein